MSSVQSRTRRVLIALAVVALNACSASTGLTEPTPGSEPPRGGDPCPEPACPIIQGSGRATGSITFAPAPLARSA